MVTIFTLNISAEIATVSIVKNARGHAMRAAIIALMLTVATQAGADDAKLNPDEWTFLECKHADYNHKESWPLKLSDLPVPSRYLAVKNDESSVIDMERDIHYDTCRAEYHTDLVCSGDDDEFSLHRFSGHINFGPNFKMICEKLDGPLF